MAGNIIQLIQQCMNKTVMKNYISYKLASTYLVFQPIMVWSLEVWGPERQLIKKKH